MIAVEIRRGHLSMRGKSPGATVRALAALRDAGVEITEVGGS